MKRSKRSRMDLISCVLEKSIEGTSERRILDACNLNISQFNLYRKFLVETGLLKVSPKEEGMDIFKATEKAREFLRDYSQVKALLSMNPDGKNEIQKSQSLDVRSI